ncbi:MAG: NAD(P)H-dependent oxidoreductase [Flavobacteriaceae bacterium]|nr:NAD(P)H-dependent oxidoreductase [Flavobacteriaceae bacterium]
MKKIIALGGSNSKKSINKALAIYAANKIKDSEVTVIDLSKYELPLYGVDLEAESGIPENAVIINNMLESSDAIVVSLAEHNGSYSTAFKNAYDWMSRINQKVWKNKPMLLMTTSPGARGGIGVLESAKMSFPHLGANIIADFSLPSFYDNFSENGLKNEELNNSLNEKIELLEKAI